MYKASIIVDYKALHQAVKAIKNQRMRIEIYPDRLLVSDCSCKDQTTVHCIGELADFPKPTERENLADALARLEEGIPEYQKQDAKQLEKIKQERREQIPLEFQEFDLPGGQFTDAMRYVLPGIAQGETRYALNGVFMTSNGSDGIELASSDTYVLYKHDVTVMHGSIPDTAGFILSPAMAGWIAKHAGECGIVSIETDPRFVFVKGGNFTLCAKRIEGTFPRYRDLIPDKLRMPGRLKTNRAAFLAALKAARPNVNPETRKIDLLPNTAGDSLIIRAIRNGEITYSTEIPAASRKWFHDAFNIEHLIDYLTVYPGDTITIHHDEADAKGSRDLSAVFEDCRLFLIMPINTDAIPSKDALEVYRAALSEPDQNFPPASTGTANTVKKPPTFKAVVAYARADPGYLSALLSALGVQAA